jgi:hypothetical protein
MITKKTATARVSKQRPHVTPQRRDRPPLLPRHGIVLHCDNVEDPGRFARLFRETWHAIPLGPRRLMLKHWRDKTSLCPLPRIVMVKFLRDNALGLCKNEGCEVQFLTDAVDLMPDECVRTLIAHELAHVYLGVVLPHLWAAADNPRWNPDGDAPSHVSRLEFEAELRVLFVSEEWGFDEDGLDRWLDQGGREVLKEANERQLALLPPLTDKVPEFLTPPVEAETDGSDWLLHLLSQTD